MEALLYRIIWGMGYWDKIAMPKYHRPNPQYKKRSQNPNPQTNKSVTFRSFEFCPWNPERIPGHSAVCEIPFFDAYLYRYYVSLNHNNLLFILQFQLPVLYLETHITGRLMDYCTHFKELANIL